MIHICWRICWKTVLLQLYCGRGPHWFRSFHHIHRFHTPLHVTYSVDSSLQTYNQLLTGSSGERNCHQHNPKFAVFLDQENSSGAYSSNAWLHDLPYTWDQRDPKGQELMSRSISLQQSSWICHLRIYKKRRQY